MSKISKELLKNPLQDSKKIIKKNSFLSSVVRGNVKYKENLTLLNYINKRLGELDMVNGGKNNKNNSEKIIGDGSRGNNRLTNISSFIKSNSRNIFKPQHKTKQKSTGIFLPFSKTNNNSSSHLATETDKTYIKIRKNDSDSLLKKCKSSNLLSKIIKSKGKGKQVYENQIYKKPNKNVCLTENCKNYACLNDSINVSHFGLWAKGEGEDCRNFRDVSIKECVERQRGGLTNDCFFSSVPNELKLQSTTSNKETKEETNNGSNINKRIINNTSKIFINLSPNLTTNATPKRADKLQFKECSILNNITNSKNINNTNNNTSFLYKETDCSKFSFSNSTTNKTHSKTDVLTTNKIRTHKTYNSFLYVKNGEKDVDFASELGNIEKRNRNIYCLKMKKKDNELIDEDLKVYNMVDVRDIANHDNYFIKSPKNDENTKIHNIFKD